MLRSNRATSKVAWALALVGACAGGCQTSDAQRPATPGPVCNPGKQEPCACPAGTLGVQRCTPDGSGYDECDCLVPGSGGGGASSGAGGLGDAGSAGAAGASGGAAGGAPGLAGAGGAGGHAGAGFAGSGGAGGGDVLAVLPENLIDDLEDGDARIIARPELGRTGAWFLFNDGSPGAEQWPQSELGLPVAGGALGTVLAAHTVGDERFTRWGAGIGFELSSAGAGREPYDVSSFEGLVFWARGVPAELRVELPTVGLTPVDSGGSCVPDEDDPCRDFWGASIALTPAWRQYVVPWTALQQVRSGGQARFEATEVLSVKFLVRAGQAFDLWIDEVAFY